MESHAYKPVFHPSVRTKRFLFVPGLVVRSERRGRDGRRLHLERFVRAVSMATVLSPVSVGLSCFIWMIQTRPDPVHVSDHLKLVNKSEHEALKWIKIHQLLLNIQLFSSCFAGLLRIKKYFILNLLMVINRNKNQKTQFILDTHCCSKAADVFKSKMF